MRNVFFFLKRTAWFIRNHFVGILISLVVFFGITGLLARLLFPEWFVPQYDVVFSGDTRVAISEAPLLHAESRVPPENFGPYLREHFSLSETIGDGDMYYSLETLSSITLSPDRSLAEYKDPRVISSAPPASLAEGEHQAREFLQQLGYGGDLELVGTSFYKLEGGHYKETSQEQSTIYNYNFVPVQNKIPLIIGENGKTILVVGVTQNGIESAILRPLYFTLTAQENQDIKSVERALQELALGEFQSEQFQKTEQRQGRFSLSEKELVYLLNENTQIMEPTYRFTGTFTNERGQTLPVEVFVKAIE